MRRLLPLLALLFAPLASATTYYVDYTNGLDSNNGTSKSTPWKHAPGMNGVSGVANSTTLNPNDSVIFKGCVTWPSSSFTWYPQFNGTSGNPIYYGVDKTWWDSTVSGCASAWNRPVFNAGGSGAPFYTNANDGRMVYVANKSYNTFDNIEFTNYYADGKAQLVGPKAADYVDFGGGQSSGVDISNCYFHGWYNPYWSIGTGNATAGSSTITNFVPYSYSQAPLNAWASSPAFATIGGGGVPEVSNGPLITGVSGSNPYTITTNGNASNFTNCSGCVITIGQDYLTITGGVEAQCLGCMMVNNVIDASDVNTVQLNPYGDCGLTESNNQVCWGSGIAGWRLPNIWRGNVIRFVNSAMVGGCSEWSNNLIEYLRLGSNPSSHTNGVECLGNWPINNISVFYNNVIRHTNNPNPSVPGGQWSIGLGQISAGPNANETDYFFGNVFYDGLQNVMFEKVTPNPSGSQSLYFGNTVDGGPTWQPNYSLANVSANDIVANNQTITTMAAPALMGSGAGSVTPITSLVMTPTTATSDGYTTSQTYVYSPISSSSPTVNAGTNKSLYCTALAAYSSAAQADCLQDTTYGVSYNVSNH